MKKSYFITWLGAITTVLITFFSVSHKTKKYGQRIHSKKSLKLNNDLILSATDKGLDFLVKKLCK